MPLGPEIDALLAGDQPSYGELVDQKYAPYHKQFLRGLAHGSTFGLWEPFKDEGKGGLAETAGNIAGAGLSFIPVARGVGAGVGALGAVAPKLLGQGVEAGQAIANM